MMCHFNASMRTLPYRAERRMRAVEGAEIRRRGELGLCRVPGHGALTPFLLPVPRLGRDKTAFYERVVSLYRDLRVGYFCFRRVVKQSRAGTVSCWLARFAIGYSRNR